MNLTLDDDSGQRLLEKLDTVAANVVWARQANSVPNLAISMLVIDGVGTNVFMLMQTGGRFVIALDTSQILPVVLRD